ncbi:MAG TPA: M1 family metallopeptidase [Syntrophomonadaceae bacterium]|nr:M1 family metallopeptidase [Syntrophomonadaceae bacterium]
MKFYWATFFVGILFAGYLLYGNRLITSAVNLSPKSTDSAAVLFPSPTETRYTMRLYLDPSTRILYGDTLLSTTNTSGKPLNDLWFTAYPNAFQQMQGTPAPSEAYYAGFNPGWLEFDEISFNGQKAEYTNGGVSVQAYLPVDVMPGQKMEIHLVWKALVPRVAYRYGTRDGVYMLGNCYPLLNVLDESGWHNSYNSLFGDPFCFPCADYMVELNVPDFYTMVCTGINKTPIIDDNGRQTYVIQAQNVRDFSLALMYDYTVLQKNMDKITVDCYVPKAKEEQAGPILDRTTDILRYFNRSLGSYPYPDFKVAFVPMKGFHGMEYSGLIFLSQDFLEPNGQKENSDFVLAHEVAHQWWYGIVGNDQIKEPWLDEGLANYSAYKYLQKTENIAPPNNALQEGTNLDRELRDMYSRQDYYLTAYSGGEAFWFGLEKELGEDTVNRVLRRYLADYRFKIANSQDLLDVIRKEAHRDMDGYFYKWFQVKPGA